MKRLLTLWKELLVFIITDYRLLDIVFGDNVDLRARIQDARYDTTKQVELADYKIHFPI